MCDQANAIGHRIESKQAQTAPNRAHLNGTKMVLWMHAIRDTLFSTNYIRIVANAKKSHSKYDLDAFVEDFFFVLH